MPTKWTITEVKSGTIERRYSTVREMLDQATSDAKAMAADFSFEVLPLILLLTIPVWGPFYWTFKFIFKNRKG